jgi:hypothetical protein
MTEGLVLLIVGLALVFVFRRFRVSPYGIVESNSVEDVFRATREPRLSFSGDAVRVLYSDVKLDVHAKGSFTEALVPLRALKICQNSSGQHFLWTYRHPQGDMRLLPLSNEEVPRLLENKSGLLEDALPNDG